MPLDHLVHEIRWSNGTQVVQRNASGPTARKWSKRAGRVTTCETPSHHAGRAVGAERERGRRNRPCSTRSAPTTGPPIARLPPARPEVIRAGHHDRPRAPAPLTTSRITPWERTQNHSPNSLHNIASRKYYSDRKSVV